MTDYHSPWRFVPLKPYVDEPNIGEAGQLRRLRETPWERPEVMERQLPPTNLPLDVYAPNAPAFAEPVNGPIAVEQPTADAPLRNRPEQPADEESAESTEPASDSEALPGEADESPSDQEDKEEVGDDVDESAARSPIIRRPARTARAPRILRAQPQPIR